MIKLSLIKTAPLGHPACGEIEPLLLGSVPVTFLSFSGAFVSVAWTFGSGDNGRYTEPCLCFSTNSLTPYRGYSTFRFPLASKSTKS